MQTREELLNDLIESLEISSAYRQRQEQLWRERGRQDYFVSGSKTNPFEDRTLALVSQH